MLQKRKSHSPFFLFPDSFSSVLVFWGGFFRTDSLCRASRSSNGGQISARPSSGLTSEGGLESVRPAFCPVA